MRHTLYADTPRLSLRRYYFVHAVAAAAVTAIDPAEHCYVACTGAAFVRLHDDIQVKLLHETHFAFFSQISYYSLIVTGQFTGPDTTICRLRV